MKKHLTTILISVLISVFSLSAVACGGGGGNGGENGSLTIRPFGGGYGTTWLSELVKTFEKETGIDVDLKPAVVDTGAWADEIKSGTSSVDLYLDTNSGFEVASLPGITVGGKKYDTFLADLTDMYNTKVPGEDILYKDKMLDTVEEGYNFDYVYDYDTKTYSNKSESGKYYITSWGGGTIGLVVNMDKWESAYGAFPNTTEELYTVCNNIVNANKSKTVNKREYPFVYSLETSYWKFLFDVWACQYLGEEEYNDYINGYDKNGDRFTKDLLRYQGFLEALTVIENCIMPRGDKEGFSHPNSTANTFTEAQFKLLNVGGGIMQPNGNWLISEMAANYKNAMTMNVKFAKTPVISNIINVLPDKSVADDKELSALITAIDIGDTALVGNGYDVTQKDYDRVAWARKYISSSSCGCGAYVPAYAKNIENAKKFLLFLAKDSSLETYYKETMGSTMPFKHDYSDSAYTPSNFIKSERELVEFGTQYVIGTGSGSKFKFYNRTGFNPYSVPYVHLGNTETYFSAENASDRKNAQQVFDYNYKYVSDNWNTNYAQYAWGD